jgi:hypothetical protein
MKGEWYNLKIQGIGLTNIDRIEGVCYLLFDHIYIVQTLRVSQKYDEYFPS